MVQVLSRDGIQRMVRKGGGSSAAGGAGGGGGLTSVALAQLTDVELGDTISDMDALVYSGSLSKWTNVSIADMATKTWVGQNYLSIAFFSRLFKAYNGTGDSATEVTPNDTTSTIDNIKAMFGFWTDAYVTALGSGGSISAAVYLSQLADVALSNPTDGQALIYDSATGKWKNGNVTSGTVTQVKVGTTPYDPVAGVVSLPAYPASASFGTAGNDYIPSTIGSTTKNVLTSHQSLSGYLPKSGGTMTGALTMPANKYATSSEYALNMSNSDIINVNSIWTADTSDDWSEGIQFKRTNGNHDTLRALDGRWYIHGNNNTPAGTNLGLRLVGSQYQMEFLIGDGNVNRGIYGNTSGKWLLYFNASNTILNFGNVGIGTTSPSHKLHVDGGIYATSYVTALSDIRKKDVVGDFDLRVADIAGASLIRFTWKDGHDKDIHVGGIAQEWKRLLPEAVREDADGTLSMDYGVIAVAASVSIARKVVAQERIINAQGKKIAELEKRLARLERMFAIDINDIEEE